MAEVAELIIQVSFEVKPLLMAAVMKFFLFVLTIQVSRETVVILDEVVLVFRALRVDRFAPTLYWATLRHPRW